MGHILTCMLILLCSYYDVLARKESSAVSDTDATKTEQYHVATW